MIVIFTTDLTEAEREPTVRQSEREHGKDTKSKKDTPFEHPNGKDRGRPAP